LVARAAEPTPLTVPVPTPNETEGESGEDPAATAGGEDDGLDAGDGAAVKPAAGGGGKTNKDPARAKELAAKAKASFRANRLDRAESLYHQALEYDPANQAATIGLAELNFERGRYRQALRFAKRASQRAPRDGRLWILLGDSHFKVLEYQDARTAYTKAKTLGHGSAAGRLARLEKTLGK
jgi:tetratricopeptide (TPR) repeat protein